jgi:hypothetical protein
MYNVVCISMTIEARYAASATGSSRIEMQAMYSAVNLEKFALTETARYSTKNYKYRILSMEYIILYKSPLDCTIW